MTRTALAPSVARAGGGLRMCLRTPARGQSGLTPRPGVPLDLGQRGCTHTESRRRTSAPSQTFGCLRFRCDGLFMCGSGEGFSRRCMTGEARRPSASSDIIGILVPMRRVSSFRGPARRETAGRCCGVAGHDAIPSHHNCERRLAGCKRARHRRRNYGDSSCSLLRGVSI